MSKHLLHFESKQDRLLPKPAYYNRLLKNLVVGLSIMLFFLSIGIIGYHITCEIGWLDSLLNASMILSGMGPVTPISSSSGKWFASLYALISGVVFISTIGIILAPVAHRVFHRFHLEDDNNES